MSMINAKKGKLLSVKGDVTCYLDENPVKFKGKKYPQTLRTVNCNTFAIGRCGSCVKYRPNLRSIYKQWSKSCTANVSSHCNERYLNTPEKKEKSSKLHSKLNAMDKQISRLNVKIRNLVEARGEPVDDHLHSDLRTIMGENTEKVCNEFPKGSFPRLLWDEQMKAASFKNAKSMRWHPLVIKWCLNLKLLSARAYAALRTSGFLKLPSERTLRDYSNVFVSKVGFQNQEVDDTPLPKRKKMISN